jgi:phosphatidylserine decarboxylase
LKYAIIYLAPGDYHRFHSPTNFTANYRRHNTGFLYPVRPSYLEKNQDALIENERVTLFGDWNQGFFALTFVGALFVGSVQLNFDEVLIQLFIFLGTQNELKNPQNPIF